LRINSANFLCNLFKKYPQIIMNKGQNFKFFSSCQVMDNFPIAYFHFPKFLKTDLWFFQVRNRISFTETFFHTHTSFSCKDHFTHAILQSIMKTDIFHMEKARKPISLTPVVVLYIYILQYPCLAQKRNGATTPQN
jgi:hypothetical protein